MLVGFYVFERLADVFEFVARRGGLAQHNPPRISDKKADYVALIRPKAYRSTRTSASTIESTRSTASFSAPNVDFIRL
jgi:hypothetical protein